MHDRLEEKGVRLGWKKGEKEDIKKKVVLIGDVILSEEEKKFLSLGYKFKVKNQKVDAEEVIYSVEQAIAQVQDKDVRDRIRRRAKVIVKKNITKGGGNLSKKEYGVLENIRRRKDICVQQADKGGAIVVMEKNWYKEKLSELCDETYELIGDRNMCEEIKEKVIVSLTKEGYRREINEDGRIPVMKGFPKIHKENVKLRPVLDCRGNMFEPLEEKIKKVAEVIRGQQESASVKNSVELKRRLREVREMRAKTIMFSVDVKAMFRA